MIMILLNLAFIPDHIVQKQDIFDDFTPGWGLRLKQAMENHKEDFNKNVKENQKITEGDNRNTVVYVLMKPKET